MVIDKLATLLKKNYLSITVLTFDSVGIFINRNRTWCSVHSTSPLKSTFFIRTCVFLHNDLAYYHKSPLFKTPGYAIVPSPLATTRQQLILIKNIAESAGKLLAKPVYC